MKYQANLITKLSEIEICKVSLFIGGQHVVSITQDLSNNTGMRCVRSLIHCFYSTYLDTTGKFREEHYDMRLKGLMRVAYYKFMKLIAGK